MSNKIDRTKTGTSVQVKGLGKRGIAIVLCFVMLLTALGTGSLLSTAAVSQSDDSNASEIAMDAASALVKAAANGADAVIPDEVINDFNDEHFVDDIEDGYDIKAADKFVREEDADLAETGFQRQDFTYVRFVGEDLSGSGLDTSYFTSSDGQNHYTGTWYVKNKNTDYANYEYNYYVKVHGKVKENDSYNYYLSLNNTVFGTGSGEHNGSSDADCVAIYENNGNMTLKVMPTSSGWIALQVNFWGDYSGNARVGLYQSAVNALNAADKSVTTDGGTGVNVMPTISGGTGNTTRSYTVRDAYGNTVSNCMSGDTFTPPYVTEETVYYVDATVTDSAISSLVDTATVTVTVSPNVSSTYRVVGASGLTGYDWNTTKNYMTQIANDSDKGTFVWKADNVSAGNYEFKIYDGSWHGWGDMDDGGDPVGSGNATLSDAGGNDHNIKLTLSAASNVTITFTNNNKSGVKWTLAADATSSTKYTTTISDADSAHNYSTAIATASPASAYEGSRVTITTTPKTGYVAKVSLSGGLTASKSGNNFYFTMPASNVTATVTYVEATSIPVTVYANTGGSVNVLYGSAVFSITEGEHDTIKVNEGDSITLTAVPDASHSFVKWYRNLEDNYNTTASITEEITSKKTYVASFGGSSSDTGFNSSTYTTEGTDFSIKYSTGNNSEYAGSSGTALSGKVRRSGNSDYYLELSAAELTAWKSASGQVRWNLFYQSTAQITDKSNYDVQYYDPTTSALKNCENGGDSTLLIKSKPDDYSGTVFIELSKIDESISSLGIHINTSTKKVDYYFGTSSGDGSTDYIPSTNYYAKDSSIREGNYNFWIYAPKTEVTAVEGEVSVDSDHTDNNKWVEGFALKGAEITVTTIIPHRGKYKYVDSTGHAGDGDNDFIYADDKYYVAGFSFNGVTPKELKESDGVAKTNVSFRNYDTSGTYTGTTTANGTAYSCTYTIPVDMKETMLEITPIIFVKDEYASETVMVYVNGFNSEVQNAGWGNTLYLYPFYQYYKSGSSAPESTYYGQAENFGRYPGQPIINYGGQLYAQIPLTDDSSVNGKDGNGGPVKGITINNGYYDDVHKNYCNHVSVHRQTYDYDDFAKIYNEKKTKNGSKYLYSIYFSFKYKEQDSSEQHRLSGTTNNIKKDENASRYNDLVASGNILNDTTGSIAKSTLETAGENSGGWEYLTDSLGNKVDLFGNKITADDEAQGSTVKPLHVFSLGYEYNNAGRWATEWAVYALNSTGTTYNLIYDNAWGIDSSSGHNTKAYNSSIVPSALIFNDKSSLSSASSLDGDLAINGYAGLYEKLEAYRGVPVKICYEYDIPDAFSPNNYRCDGRWTYTTIDDFVRSNIKIEYYDKNGALQTDSFADDSHVGQTTGCSAYFTNSAYYGATQSDSEIIDNSKSYTFKAENVGSYEFVGWYMYDTAGHESTITKTSLSADTPRSGNFVLAARFKYIASGNLTISNSLKSGSEGRATTYLGVTLINGDKQTPIANVNSNTKAVTIDKSYINANSNYQIRIDIRTVPSGENTFKEYTCYTTDGHTGTDVRSAASDADIYNASNKTNTTDSYTITVKGDVYDSTTTNQQNVKAIEYISELNPVKYTYSVKFNYTSRQYGDQAFTQTGSLTAGQINDTNVVTGSSGQANKKLTKAFLAQIAPHESNFNEDITWNFDAVVNSQTCTYNSETNTYAIVLNIPIANVVTEQNVARKGYFTVPYAQTNGVANSNNGVVTKADDTTFIIDANYNEYFKTGGNFVTAPAVIHDSDDDIDLPFQYWEVSTRTSDRGNSRVISKCYFPEFNLRCLDNYDIRAVYGDAADAYNYAAMFAAEDGTSVSFIGNSRNQWNNGDSGTAAANSGDIIYNDFILTCKPKGDVLFKNLDNDGTKCGVIIQQVKNIEINSSGANAKTLQEYAADYKTEDLTAASEAALALAKAGTASNTVTLNGVSVKQRLMSIDKSNINEKNRCHYSLPMSNTKDDSGALKNAKYLYRAYSYIAYDADGDGTIETGEWFISEDPAYFYMYDIAVM